MLIIGPGIKSRVGRSLAVIAVSGWQTREITLIFNGPDLNERVKARARINRDETSHYVYHPNKD